MNLYSQAGGILLIAVPGLALIFAVSVLISKDFKRVVRLAPWATAPGLFCAFSVSAGFKFSLPWMMLGSTLIADDMGATVLFVTSVIWLFGALQMVYGERRYSRLFYGCFYLAMAGNMGLLLATDALIFYLFFALMSFAAYGLIVEDSTPESFRSGRVYMALVIIGEIALFVGISLIAAKLGTSELAQIANRPISKFAILLLIVGFGIKAGLVPLHFSLPLVYSSAPAPAQFVLAGAMLNAGVFGWLRFLPMDVGILPGWGEVMILVGLISVFYGVACGLVQSSAYALLAYSSISQIGYVVLLIGFGLVFPDNGALIHGTILLFVIHHALAKAALFWGCDIWQTSKPGRIDRIIAGTGLFLAALALSGAPLTSGALTKATVTVTLSPLLEQQTEFYTFLMPLGALATTLLMVRFYFLCRQHSKAATSRVSVSAYLYAGLIGVLAIAAWFFVPANIDLHSIFKPAKIWAGIWPILLGIGIFFFCRLICRAAAKSNRLVIPPGDIVVILERGIAGCMTGYILVSRATEKALVQVRSRAGDTSRRLLHRTPARVLPWRSATIGACLMTILFILVGLMKFQ